MERITSRTNPLLTHIRRLAASGSYRRQCGEYLGDSPKLLQEALLWKAELVCVVHTGAAELPPLPADVRAVEVPADIMTSVSPMKTPQGVLFTCRIPARVLPAAPAPSLTENPVFQGFVLLLAATYAILLYRNLGDIRLLLTRVSHDTATGKRLMEDPGGSGFSHFLNTATAIGVLFVGVMTVKYGDSLIPDSLIETIPQGAVLALSLLATFACLCVGLFQRGVVRLAGAVTLSQPFVSQLILLKRTYFTLGVIVTIPALLLFALCPRGTGDVWFCIIVIELLATVFLYLRETLNLFLSKKISILHWILYLCIVEIFPISLLGLLAAR